MNVGQKITWMKKGAAVAPISNSCGTDNVKEQSVVAGRDETAEGIEV